MIGWHPDGWIYQQVAQRLANHGVSLFLWLPVLSELGLLTHTHPVIGASGRPPERFTLDETEDFQFYCPNDPANLTAVIDVFDSHFANIGFDGVFLDKIRYPSFANGADGGLSCFCPHCLESYAKAGLDADALTHLPDVRTPFGATAYQNGSYQFDDPMWASFLGLRQDIVFDAISQFVDHLRLDGYQIGLDVFAPFLAPFVGQDITRLSSLADFVKPMMYATTNSPAGLPFETNALLANTGQRQPFSQLLGFDQSHQPFDLQFCANQVTQLQATSLAPVHVGIEVNQIPGVANTSPAYISQCLDAYRDADGIVLSWNLLDMPPAHLQAVAQSISR